MQRRPWIGSRRWDDLYEHCFRIGAPTDRQSNTAQAARNHEQRGAASVSSLVKTIAALTNDRRAMGQPYLAAVSVARKSERYAARDGFVEMVWIMRHQQMRHAVRRSEPLPIRFAEQQIIDTAEDKRTAAMSERKAFIF